MLRKAFLRFLRRLGDLPRMRRERGLLRSESADLADEGADLEVYTADVPNPRSRRRLPEVWEAQKRYDDYATPQRYAEAAAMRADARVDRGDGDAQQVLEYWRAVMLHKWTILALALAAGAAAYVLVSRMDPVYRSRATVVIAADRSNLVPIGEPSTGIVSNFREYFQTQAEVIQSREVAERVIANLDLAHQKEFNPPPAQPSAIRTWTEAHVPMLRELIARPPADVDPSSAHEQIVDAFARRLSVEPGRQSQLIRVGFEAHDPKLAAAVANATVQAYIQMDREARSAFSRNAGQQINTQLAELKSTLDASEKALQAYREREGLLDNKSSVLSGTGRQFDELTQKLVDARVRRVEAEQAYNQVKAGEASDYESVPAVAKSLAVQRAKESEADAEKRLAEISQRSGPDHPKFIAASADAKAARTNVRKQIQSVVASVIKEFEAARATEKTIQDALAQSKGTIQSLNRKEIQLNMLEREAAANRQLYQAFLSRSKETNATKDTQESVARVIDKAVPALRPVSPSKSRAVLIAALLALIVGMLASITLYRVNNTFKTDEDVEKALHRPLLAALPTLPRTSRKRRGRAVLDRPHDLYAESIRVASTSVLLSALDTPHKIVTVTSSVLDEGKSTFAINLAFSQAKSKRVLLIEGDMRRPCFGKAMMLVPGQKGLAELLAGNATLQECLLRIEGTDLHVIAVGHIPPNPHELLLSQRFRELLAALRERYDVIVIDSPPVQLVSDALVIGAQSTGVIFVVNAEDTPIPLAQKALRRIEHANIPVFGVVLNQKDFKKAEKYYGEYSGYEKYWYGAQYGARS
jgi:capsular exopolysaccharide synthesis family protein